jgi:hypothetical protein
MSTPTPGRPDDDGSIIPEDTAPEDAAMKPVILDGHAETFTPAPTRPGQMVMRPASAPHAAIRGGVAALLVVAGVVNLVFGGRFPSNAPVESLVMFFLSLDMFVGGVVLGVFAVLANIRRSVPVLPERTSPLSVAALVLAAVAFAGWVLFGLTLVIGALSRGELLHYTDTVGAILILGVPWMLGLVFGVISLRSGGRRTPLFAGIAIGIGILLLLVVVASTIAYGLGLTT